MRKCSVAVMGGIYAGALLGSLAGAAEAVLFLERANLTATPGKSLLFLLCSIALYALVMSACGAAMGVIASLVRRGGRTAEPRYGRALSAAFGAITGLFTFVLTTWWVRLAPPDLAIFRRYCLSRTLLMLLISVIVAWVTFQIVRRIARADRVEHYLSSRWARNWTFAKLAVALVLLLIVFRPESSGRARGTASPAAAGNGVNVVLITIDTLRHDHLELAGYRKPTSPVSRELSEKSVIFRECVAQYPLTTPSHASILTARYVRSHGATSNAVALHESAVLLSEILKDNGYATGAFVTTPLVGSKYGFDKGYDRFVERNRGDFMVSTLSDWLGQLRISRIWWRLRGTERTTVATRRWLEGNPDTPFFMWIHHIAPHSPYAPPLAWERRWDVTPSSIIPSIRGLKAVNRGDVEIDPDDIEHIISLYDAEIEFTEGLVGDTIDALRRQGFLDNTLIVFTADHGESLFDRARYFGHGTYLHDEEILVPLFFYCPARLPAGRAIDVPVETIHIAPTILDFLGLPPEPSFQGMSLMDFISPGHPNPDNAHVRHPLAEKPAFTVRDGAKSKAVRFRGWKYIEPTDPTEGSELYDLRNDPGETQNVLHGNPERAEELRELLAEWDAGVTVARSGSYELDAESIRALRSLGYLE